MRHSMAETALRAMLSDLARGTRLPAERKLAGQIGCSRQTLRVALASLARERLIWRHVGQGTFVGPPARGQPLRLSVLIEGAAPGDLLRARLAIEPQIAAEAARHAKPADLRRLQELLRSGRQASDRAECEQIDSDFHLALAGISGNPVLLGVMRYLSDIRRHAAWQQGWERSYRRLPPNEFQTSHSDQHAAIISAVAARDPTAATAAMTRHLQTVRAAFSS